MNVYGSKTASAFLETLDDSQRRISAPVSLPPLLKATVGVRVDRLTEMPSPGSTRQAVLVAAHAEMKAEAAGLAGGPGDMPQRVAVLHSIFEDSGRNHAFPEVALHGALWAYGFYERRGAVSRMITYRYFYDREERARRAYMLFVFSQGFKEANRAVFMDTYANYYFTKRHGEEAGADEVVAPELLDALNRVHRAARSAQRCRLTSAARSSKPPSSSSRRRLSDRRSRKRSPSSTARS